MTPLAWLTVVVLFDLACLTVVVLLDGATPPLPVFPIIVGVGGTVPCACALVLLDNILSPPTMEAGGSRLPPGGSWLAEQD